MEEIILKVMPDGTVKIQVSGVSGDECLELTEFIEKSLGTVVEREKTHEFNLPRIVDKTKGKYRIQMRGAGNDKQ
ncbi:DUF2997 domain-containing protein [candidate division KSB1 bacterium]|nr:DUF2997 domain-containing protein [candidate division KSB1 bacterium]